MEHPVKRAGRQIGLVALIAIPLLGCLDALAPSAWSRNDGSYFILLIIFAGMMVRMIKATTYRCPGCRRSFFVRSGYGNPFSRTCLHCGKRYDEPPLE